LEIVSINMGESADTVKAYIVRHDLSFTHLLDQHLQVASMFSVRATPSNFLVNRKGCVVGGGPGYRDWTAPAAHQLIVSLLTEDPPQPC
jgi:thioredoxin-related protein